MTNFIRKLLARTCHFHAFLYFLLLSPKDSMWLEKKESIPNGTSHLSMLHESIKLLKEYKVLPTSLIEHKRIMGSFPGPTTVYKYLMQSPRLGWHYALIAPLFSLSSFSQFNLFHAWKCDVADLCKSSSIQAANCKIVKIAFLNFGN